MNGQADPGPRQSDFVVEYTSGGADARSDRQTSRVEAAPRRPDFEVDAAITLAAGSSRTLTVDVDNNREETLSDITANLYADSPLSTGTDESFVDEYTPGTDVFEALRTTIQGTGGALTGSMLTTVFGLGALLFAIIPLIREFGLLLGPGVFYAYACSVVLLPSIIVLRERAADRSERVPTLALP